MAEPFLGEIRLMSFNIVPKGWAMCNGQLLPINQNQALFALLGTGFGGDGRVNFALPDLRGRVPIHFGSAHNLYARGGQEAHTVTISEMPMHTHVLSANSAPATTVIPNNSLLFAQPPFEIYRPPSSLGAMQPASVTNVGGSQPHTNLQPYLPLNFCIALQGIFPSQT